MIKLDEGTMPVHTDNGKIILIDQRKLPDTIEYFDATDIDQMCFAICDMVVRGAPSISAAAALSMAAHVKKVADSHTAQISVALLDQVKEKLDATRPTAVNLKWATGEVHDFASALLNENLSNKEFGEKLFRFAEAMLQDHFEQKQEAQRFRTIYRA